MSFDQKQLDKLALMRERGVNPYPHGITGSLDYPAHVVNNCTLMQNNPDRPEYGDVVFTLQGRIRSKRGMGNIGFADLQGPIGGPTPNRVQIMVQKNNLTPDEFWVWKKLDVGDQVQVTGTCRITKAGEPSLNVTRLTLGAKCVSGLPDRQKGLTSVEARARHRYLDLMVNDSTREVFLTRSKALYFIREFMCEMGFDEVETPMLHPILGGADARPFTTHHNALGTDFYLRIAPELYLKRLVVGGFNRVYEINRCFRNEGISTKHNPEFTSMEWYYAWATLEDMYTMIQDLIEYLQVRFGFEVFGSTTDIRNGFPRRTMQSLIEEHSPVKDATDVDELEHYWHEDVGPLSMGAWWEEYFDRYVEKKLVTPTFVTRYPTDISPLARQCDDDPRFTDRFELFVQGMELANGFCELNDPVEQAARFNAQLEDLHLRGVDRGVFDENYINALSYGMPPTVGAGLGIDRLIMLITGCKTIRDTLLFPTLRPL